MFYLILIFVVQSACALGYCLSSLFNHETTAVAIAPLFSLTLNVLGGYMVNIPSLTGIQLSVKWLQWISPTRWGFSGLLQAQFPVPIGLVPYNKTE